MVMGDVLLRRLVWLFAYSLNLHRSKLRSINYRLLLLYKSVYSASYEYFSITIATVLPPHRTQFICLKMVKDPAGKTWLLLLRLIFIFQNICVTQYWRSKYFQLFSVRKRTLKQAFYNWTILYSANIPE